MKQEQIDYIIARLKERSTWAGIVVLLSTAFGIVIPDTTVQAIATAGVALATLALIAYDGLAGRVEQLSDSLDRVGAETIDAIALALPAGFAVEPRGVTPGAAHGPHGPSGPTRTPSQVRLEVPIRPAPRVEADDDLD